MSEETIQTSFMPWYTAFRGYTATIVGLDHQQSASNGHDGYFFGNINLSMQPSHYSILGIVCDGCGSQTHSEVGANLGASIVANAIRKQQIVMGGMPDIFDQGFWEAVKERVVEHLDTITADMMFNGYANDNLITHFLFTCVGFLVQEEKSVVFHIGDGCYAVNDDYVKIAPMEGNYPPYISYNLMTELDLEIPSHLLTFRVHPFMTKDVNSLLIATDGFEEVLKASGKPFPGSDEIIPDMTECWKEEKYFSNALLMHRKLRLMGQTQYRMKDHNGSKKLMKYPGLLHDDVTVICIRRFF